MAERVNIEPAVLHKTLKNTVFKGASDDELVALVLVANEYGLNPLVKQLYAFPTKGGGITPMVPIDGWLHIINNHPQFDGMETEDIRDDKGNLLAVECIIHRKDRKHPIKIREYLTECRRKTEPWEQYPSRMLRHKAIMQCGRIAFGISGIHDEDEARTIGERQATGREVTGDDPMTAGVAPKAETAPALTLSNELKPRERLEAEAQRQGLPPEALICDAAEAGLVREAPLDDLTDDEIELILG